MFNNKSDKRRTKLFCAESGEFLELLERGGTLFSQGAAGRGISVGAENSRKRRGRRVIVEATAQWANRWKACGKY